MKKHPTLTRKTHQIPDYVLEALKKKRLMKAYESRPPFQQNDYIGWINRAKLPATKEKRLNQMLDELKRGDVYMHMDWNPKTSTKTSDGKKS